MSALAEGAAAINTSLEMPDVWRRILNQTMQALQVETVALALIDPAGERPDLFLPQPDITPATSPDGHSSREGSTGQVIRDRHGSWCQTSNWIDAIRTRTNSAGIEMRAIAIAPIQSQGRVIGALEAINPISGAFDPDAMLVMTGLGSLAGTTIQNAQFLEKLQKAHKRYRELFEDSVDPILITDWEGRSRSQPSGCNLERIRTTANSTA